MESGAQFHCGMRACGEESAMWSRGRILHGSDLGRIIGAGLKSPILRLVFRFLEHIARRDDSGIFLAHGPPDLRSSL